MHVHVKLINCMENENDLDSEAIGVAPQGYWHGSHDLTGSHAQTQIARRVWHPVRGELGDCWEEALTRRFLYLSFLGGLSRNVTCYAWIRKTMWIASLHRRADLIGFRGDDAVAPTSRLAGY